MLPNDQEFAALNDKLLTMASLATNATRKALRALIERDDELARGWCECFYGSRDANTDLHDAVNAWLSAFAQAAPTDAATVIVHVRWRIHVLARGDYPPWQFLALDDGAGRVVEAFVEEGA